MKFFIKLLSFLLLNTYVLSSGSEDISDDIFADIFDSTSIETTELPIISTTVLPQTSTKSPKRCEHYVNSSLVIYKGCKEYVNTDSLTNFERDVSGRKAIYTFKGIPYAEPPVGSLRFQKTVPKIYTTQTTIDATHYRNPCMQPLPLDLPLPSGLPSENCLYLNVWTPTMNSSANLSVMIWIHGGAFLFGSGSQLFLNTLSVSNVYSGTQLALRDVIVVTFNYRLGVFGFLYGNSSDCPGNVGFWDQAMALNWVKQNIKYFGGNPDNITLFGQSAGSVSISNHIVSNVTRNLFNRAIMQSGSGYQKLFSRDKEYSYSTARRFASNANLFSKSCKDDNNWTECLRNKSAFELLVAQSTAILWNPSQPWATSYITPFVPIFGDEFTPISIPKALKDGNFKTDIKILLGHNEMEGSLFAAAFDVLRVLLGRYTPLLPLVPIINKNIVINDIKKIFIDNDTIGVNIANAYTEPFSDLSIFFNQNPIRRSAVYSLGDYLFMCPTILFGGHLVSNSLFTGKVFQYRLTYANSQSISRLSVWSEVTHNEDIPLVFGHPFKNLENILYSKDDRNISQLMMNIWTDFAKYGEVPKVNGNVWPEYSLNSDNSVNASYIELHTNPKRLGKVYVNRYDGINDGYNPSVIGNCFNFWDQILSDQF